MDINQIKLDNKFKLVEASAGTGKSFTLAHIVLRNVLEKKVKPDEILLLSFTKNTCSELRDKILLRFKDLGSNLSPFPRPIANGELITSGIYRFIRHPMYYSLILFSLGIFIIKLSFYYLFLTISLTLVIKFKIALEEKYLMNKFKNYLLYKNEVKV